MWIRTRPRSEQETGLLLNLNQASRITISKLGEKWFLESMLGTDAFPIAATTSQEEAESTLQQIFDALQAGEKALDLSAEPPAQVKPET